MNLTFKVGSSGCGGRFESPGFPGRAALSVVFSTFFVLYLNDLPSEVLTLMLSILSLY